MYTTGLFRGQHTRRLEPGGRPSPSRPDQVSEDGSQDPRECRGERQGRLGHHLCRPEHGAGQLAPRWQEGRPQGQYRVCRHALLERNGSSGKGVGSRVRCYGRDEDHGCWGNHCRQGNLRKCVHGAFLGYIMDWHSTQSLCRLLLLRRLQQWLWPCGGNGVGRHGARVRSRRVSDAAPQWYSFTWLMFCPAQ